MRVGILKLGANITWSKNVLTAANVDIHTMCRALFPFSEICIISGKTRNTKIPTAGTFYDIRSIDVNSLDLSCLLVFNGNVNFFGGTESPEGILNYVHINKFKGPVFIVNTDGQLAFKQLWPAIEPKPWAKNWNREDVWVSRTDIQYITQARDLRKTKKTYEKQKNFIKPSAYYSFPIEQAILIDHDKRPIKLRLPKYDLIYGGRPRSTGRQKDIDTFYIKHSQELKVHLFGGFSKKNLRSPAHEGISFGSKVSNFQFIPKMSEGFFTCIVGDPFYHGNFFTLRMYESILAGCTPFISTSMDPDREFYSDEYLKEFLYVNSGEELATKIKAIKFDEMGFIYDKVFSDKVLSFNAEEYSSNLNSLIRKGIQEYSDII